MNFEEWFHSFAPNADKTSLITLFCRDAYKVGWDARDKEISELRERIRELEEYEHRYKELCK